MAGQNLVNVCYQQILGEQPVGSCLQCGTQGLRCPEFANKGIGPNQLPQQNLIDWRSSLGQGGKLGHGIKGFRAGAGGGHSGGGTGGNHGLKQTGIKLIESYHKNAG